MKHLIWLALLFSGAAMAAPAPNCTAGDLTFTGTGSSADYDACKNSNIPAGNTAIGSAFTDGGNPIYVGFHLRGCTAAAEYSATGLPDGITIGDYGQLLGTATTGGSGTATITCDPANADPGDDDWSWTVTGGSITYASGGYISGNYGTEAGSETCVVNEDTNTASLGGDLEGSFSACLNDRNGVATNPTPRIIQFAGNSYTLYDSGDYQTNQGNLTVACSTAPGGSVTFTKEEYSNGANLDPGITFTNGGGNNSNNVYIENCRVLGLWPANTANHFNGSNGIAFDGENGGGPIDNVALVNVSVGNVQDDPITFYGEVQNSTIMDVFTYNSHRGITITHSAGTQLRQNIAVIRALSVDNDERNILVRGNSQNIDVDDHVADGYGTTDHGIGGLAGTAGFNLRARSAVCPQSVNVRGGHYTSNPTSPLTGALNVAIDSCDASQLYFGARLPSEETETGGAGSAFSTTVAYSPTPPATVTANSGAATDTPQEAALRARVQGQIITDNGAQAQNCTSSGTYASRPGTDLQIDPAWGLSDRVLHAIVTTCADTVIDLANGSVPMTLINAGADPGTVTGDGATYPEDAAHGKAFRLESPSDAGFQHPNNPTTAGTWILMFSEINDGFQDDGSIRAGMFWRGTGAADLMEMERLNEDAYFKIGLGGSLRTSFVGAAAADWNDPVVMGAGWDGANWQAHFQNSFGGQAADVGPLNAPTGELVFGHTGNNGNTKTMPAQHWYFIIGNGVPPSTAEIAAINVDPWTPFQVSGGSSAPILSNANQTGVTDTNATMTVDTDTLTGTMYTVEVQESSLSLPSGTQMEAGQSSTGAAGFDASNFTVNGSTTQTVTLTNHSPLTDYCRYWMHKDGGLDSTVVGSCFTTSDTVAAEPGALYPFPPHPGTEAIVTNGLTCASANVECPTSVATALTAIANADPGDYILLRGAAGGGPAGGIYIAGTQGGSTDGATLSVSGTAGSPIYLSNYPGEFVEWYGGEDELSWRDYDSSVNNSTKPYSGDQDGFQIDGDYWHIQGLKINGWARFGIRVSGDYNVIAGNWVNRTWLTSIFVMGASDTDTIGTQVIGNYTSYSYHGSGVSLGATHSLTNPWTADNTLFAQNICYHHGYQEDGDHSSGIGGDGGAGTGPGMGGENSDCAVISKGCFGGGGGGNGEPFDWRCGSLNVYRNMSLEMGDDHFDLGNEQAKAYGNMGIGKVEKGGKGIKTLSSYSKAHEFVGNGFWGDLTASGLDDGVEHRQLATAANTLGNYSSVNNGVFGASVRGGFYVPGPDDTPTIRNELFRNNAADFGETASWDIPDRSNALWFSSDPDPLHAGNCEGLTMTDMDLTTLDDFLTQQDNSSYLDLYTDLAGPCALTGASPAVDAGTFIPGIHCPVADDTGSNPDVSCRRWCGTAPDYGPFEYCP